MMCHRLSTSPATAGVGQLTSQSCYKKDKMFDCASASSGIVDAMYSNALCSWTYPQSSLPTTIISAMALSAAKRRKRLPITKAARLGRFISESLLHA
ncbi:protein downstream neighbor of son-like protein isoform X1 [Iris pallida]|uniref:Protein downstream neighbor of son-like protein isoform X1 n=1 Tax=Iris pallida TaxID=29817 RepID=A0AAX6FXH6_IRIPA|nr:protein downstream neighbor of son-like protein isoform X1 [Iris pallida]